jgi:hypothetical protein
MGFMEFSRKWLETVSVPLLTRLHSMPRWIFPFFTAALLLMGLFIAGPIGAFFLAALVVLLGWLLFLSWPLIATGSRLLRVIALALLLSAFWIQLNS